MVEQLWYTWTPNGLSGNVGYQERAASVGLRQITGRRVLALRPYMNYALPQGADPSIATPAIAPATLAFLDTRRDATPEGYENTHIVLRKVLKGSDANGRPGVFFAHLLDKLPREFVASDAIDLWAASFWCSNDELSPPPADLTLRQLQQSEVQSDPFRYTEILATRYREILVPHLDAIRTHLPNVIQAFFALRDDQKLYLIAPSDLAAALIWGLLHALPRSLQKTKNITFSTYEKDVTQTPARIVSTCRADPRLVYKQSIGRLPQPLPANAFSGVGLALAVDCEGDEGKEPKLLEKNATDIFYANKVTGWLLNGQMRELEEKVRLAEKNGVENTIGMRSFIKTHITEQELAPEEVLALLRKPKQAARDLGSDNALRSLLKHWRTLPAQEWRDDALLALETLRLIVRVHYLKTFTKQDLAILQRATEQGQIEEDLTREDVAGLYDAFKSLSGYVADAMARDFMYEETFAVLKTLWELVFFETYVKFDAQARLFKLLRLLALQPGFEQAHRGLTWDTRGWMLVQAADVARLPQSTDADLNLILFWLPQNWGELELFLEAEKPFPARWQSLSIRNCIYGSLRADMPFPRNSARKMLEKYTRQLFAAIAELLQRPETQQDALYFCRELLKITVTRQQGLVGAVQDAWQRGIDAVLFIPRRCRDAWWAMLYSLHLAQERPEPALPPNWQSVVIPFLGIEIAPPAPPIRLDEVLQAAQLRREDQYFLLNQYAHLLLTRSHLWSAYLEEMSAAFLDTLIEQLRRLARESGAHRFGSFVSLPALQRLQVAAHWKEQWRYTSVNYLLSLAIASDPGSFKKALLSNKSDFLPDLVAALREFGLAENQAYRHHLYGVILKIPLTLQDLDRIIDQLAYLLEKKSFAKKSAEAKHMENKREFLVSLVDHATRNELTFPGELLLTYLGLAFRYTEELKNPEHFLVPALQAIVKRKNPNYAVTKLNNNVRNAFAENTLYLRFWELYKPKSVDKGTAARRAAQKKGGETQQQPQRESMHVSKPQHSADEAPIAAHLSNEQRTATAQPVDERSASAIKRHPVPPPAYGNTMNATSYSPASEPEAGRLEQPDATQPGNKHIDESQPAPLSAFVAPDPTSDASYQPPAFNVSPDIDYQKQAAEAAISLDARYQESPATTSPDVEYRGQVANGASAERSFQNDASESVERLATAFAIYAPWRIQLLRDEFQQLEKAKKDAKKGDQLSLIKIQQFSVLNEQNLLETLSSMSKDWRAAVQRVLENDQLIKQALGEFGIVAVEDGTYQHIRQHPTYNREIGRKIGEHEVTAIFAICNNYRILSKYLHEQEENQEIEEWIGFRRMEEGFYR